MKYITMTGLMDRYGQIVKTYRNLYIHTTFGSHLITSDATDCRPFRIRQYVNTKAGQVLNTLEVNMPKTVLSNYHRQIPDVAVFPPILEIEWLKRKSDLNNETIEVLTQTAYMWMYRMLSWKDSCHYPGQNEHPSWTEYMEDAGIITEVEDLSDTVEILKRYPLNRISYPKIRNWNTILFYGCSYRDLISLCRNQYNIILTLYWNMIMLVIFFMREYTDDGLKLWPKKDRIMEKTRLAELMASFDNISTASSRIYTYGQVNSSFTWKDIQFICSTLEWISEKIDRANVNLGIISFEDYGRLIDTMNSTVSVRLTNMKISWPSEMERVRLQKEKIKTESEKDQ